MRIAISTSLLDLSSPATRSPEGAVDRLRVLVDNGPARGMAVDPRLAPEQQRQLIVAAARGPLRCVELAHPFARDKRPAASLIAGARDERRAAGRQLAHTVALAADHEVGRVVVYPGWLDLSPSIDQLCVDYAMAEPLVWHRLQVDRARRLPQAMDGLCSVLDAALEMAAGLGVELLLPTPCPWPHQVPALAEQAELLREFSGAPLGLTHFADWAHAARCLQSATAVDEAAKEAAEGAVDVLPDTINVGKINVVRLADACGLSLRLPLGCGELDPGALPLQDATELVLTLDVGVTPAEVQRSLEWIGSSAASSGQRSLEWIGPAQP